MAFTGTPAWVWITVSVSSRTSTSTWSSSAVASSCAAWVPAVPAISGVSSLVAAGGAFSVTVGATVSRSVFASSTTVTSSAAVGTSSTLPALSVAIV